MSADMHELDAAFELPDVIQDAKLRTLYEVLVARMRREASHLPMNTIQQLLIERIAYNYIVLRSKERGELGGFAHSTVQKDYNTFWLTMTAEFNRMLGKSDVMNGHDRKALMRDMQAIIVNSVSGLRDPKERAEVLEKLAAEFEKAGI